jgi:hypothetical protein
MTHMNTEASQGDLPATCRFPKVLLSGLPPLRSEVDALLRSLDARCSSHDAREAAESRPQAVAESGALATVLTFSSHRKRGRANEEVQTDPRA